MKEYLDNSLMKRFSEEYQSSNKGLSLEESFERVVEDPELGFWKYRHSSISRLP